MTDRTPSIPPSPVRPFPSPRPSDVAICIMEVLQIGGPAYSVFILTDRVNEDLDVSMWVDEYIVVQAVIELIKLGWIAWQLSPDIESHWFEICLTEAGRKAAESGQY